MKGYLALTFFWILVIVVTWNRGLRKLPICVTMIGLFIHLGIWLLNFGFWGVGALGFLTAVAMLGDPEFFAKERQQRISSIQQERRRPNPRRSDCEMGGICPPC